MDKYQWTCTGMSVQPVENGPMRYVREVDYDALQAKIEELTADAERATYLEEELTSARIEIEVRNAAYEIACSNSLTESITYDELQEISDEDLMAIAWEPFENWDASDLHCHIAQIARAIMDAFPADENKRLQAKVEELEKQLKDALHLLFKSEDV